MMQCVARPQAASGVAHSAAAVDSNNQSPAAAVAAPAAAAATAAEPSDVAPADQPAASRARDGARDSDAGARRRLRKLRNSSIRYEPPSSQNHHA